MMDMMKTLQTQQHLSQVDSRSSSEVRPNLGKGILPTPIHIPPLTSIPKPPDKDQTTTANSKPNTILLILQSQTQIWPRLEFPIFDGKNPRHWLRRRSKIFQIYQIHEDFQVETAAMFLDSKPDVWFREWKEGKTELTWEDFVSALCHRFGEKEEEQVAEDFHCIK